MPQTLVKTADEQIIGGTFSKREDADKAIEAFHKAGVPDQNIQVVVQPNDKQTKEAYSDMLTNRGFADGQAAYYDKALREGKTLVVISGVVDAAPIIDIFDDFGAVYNPDGSRNAREDVSGMTAGAAIGAAAGGVAGALIAGPLGAVGGAAAGAVVGAGGGAAAGTAAEHRK